MFLHKNTEIRLIYGIVGVITSIKSQRRTLRRRKKSSYTKTSQSLLSSNSPLQSHNSQSSPGNWMRWRSTPQRPHLRQVALASRTPATFPTHQEGSTLSSFLSRWPPCVPPVCVCFSVYVESIDVCLFQLFTFLLLFCFTKHRSAPVLPFSFIRANLFH